ncbi:MAG: dTMP kinase [Actinomycetota bacterium]|nr:dTMP kinase [Actinomycetota bacterium]
MTGRFIAFEGGEASGKSTQAARLAERLGAVMTREPGGTDVGRALRALVLDPAAGTLDPRAEALLMLADRAQHVAEVVGPALARGVDVVSDRFSGSTLAYQGYARGLDVGELSRLSAWASGGLEPDLVILLDVAADVAVARLRRDLDRMEQAGDAFHRRVVEGYHALAAGDPARWCVVDGSGTPDQVSARVIAAFEGWSAVAG